MENWLPNNNNYYYTNLPKLTVWHRLQYAKGLHTATSVVSLTSKNLYHFQRKIYGTLIGTWWNFDVLLERRIYQNVNNFFKICENCYEAAAYEWKNTYTPVFLHMLIHEKSVRIRWIAQPATQRSYEYNLQKNAQAASKHLRIMLIRHSWK